MVTLYNAVEATRHIGISRVLDLGLLDFAASSTRATCLLAFSVAHLTCLTLAFPTPITGPAVIGALSRLVACWTDYLGRCYKKKPRVFRPVS